MLSGRLWTPRRWADWLSRNAGRIAEHRWSLVIVFTLEAIGSTVLPLPNSLLMVGLITAAPRKWARFALSATCGSIVGGVALYIIGRAFFESIGQPLITFYGAQSRWAAIDTWFDSEWGIVFVLLAGLSTGLFRVAGLGAGFTAMNPALFLVILSLSRTARWIAECGAIKYVGERVRSSPSRYFKYVTIAVAAVFILAVLVATLSN